MGDIFRWNVQTHTKLGARLFRAMAAGQLVSDEIVEEVVRARLEQHDWNYGFILDGFPRAHRQAEFFLESYDIDAVIHIDLVHPISSASPRPEPVRVRPLVSNGRASPASRRAGVWNAPGTE